MNKIVHYIGLDVHKETIAVAIAADPGELRHYGKRGGNRCPTWKPSVIAGFAGCNGWAVGEHATS